MPRTFEDYPKGQISMQGGELQDAYDINLDMDGAEVDVHTFGGKGEPSGSTGGKKKNMLTFKSAISFEGFERDYVGNHKKRKVVQCRVKVPGKTFVLEGRIGKLTLTSNVDGFVDCTVTMSGRLTWV